MIELDHLAVAAPTLDDGRKYVEETLGVVLQPGGQHAHFGTHNLLLGLEDGLYLEVIAVDPSAPAPGYPRWFDLDRFTGAPRLHNWICRSTDLNTVLQAMPDAGAPVALSRGDLRWQMAVPPSGILPFDNLFPALIEWQGKAHPAPRLTASGCRLDRLIISHPRADDLKSALAGRLEDRRIVYEAGDPGLRAELSTPSGPKVLA